MTVRDPAALREVARLLLRLGITAFGGPAAHIAMMRDEVVRRRRWVDDARFLEPHPGAELHGDGHPLGYVRRAGPG